MVNIVDNEENIANLIKNINSINNASKAIQTYSKLLEQNGGNEILRTRYQNSLDSGQKNVQDSMERVKKGFDYLCQGVSEITLDKNFSNQVKFLFNDVEKMKDFSEKVSKASLGNPIYSEIDRKYSIQLTTTENVMKEIENYKEQSFKSQTSRQNADLDVTTLEKDIKYNDSLKNEVKGFSDISRRERNFNNQVNYLLGELEKEPEKGEHPGKRKMLLEVLKNNKNDLKKTQEELKNQSKENVDKAIPEKGIKYDDSLKNEIKNFLDASRKEYDLNNQVDYLLGKVGKEPEKGEHPGKRKMLLEVLKNNQDYLKKTQEELKNWPKENLDNIFPKEDLDKIFKDVKKIHIEFQGEERPPMVRFTFESQKERDNLRRFLEDNSLGEVKSLNINENSMLIFKSSPRVVATIESYKNQKDRTYEGLKKEFKEAEKVITGRTLDLSSSDIDAKDREKYKNFSEKYQRNTKDLVSAIFSDSTEAEKFSRNTKIGGEKISYKTALGGKEVNIVTIAVTGKITVQDVSEFNPRFISEAIQKLEVNKVLDKKEIVEKALENQPVRIVERFANTSTLYHEEAKNMFKEGEIKKEISVETLKGNFNKLVNKTFVADAEEKTGTLINAAKAESQKVFEGYKNVLKHVDKNANKLLNSKKESLNRITIALSNSNVSEKEHIKALSKALEGHRSLGQKIKKVSSSDALAKRAEKEIKKVNGDLKGSISKNKQKKSRSVSL